MFIRVLRLGLGNARAVSSYETDGRLRKTLDFFGRPLTSSGIFGNDRDVLKYPSTPRIKSLTPIFQKKLAGILALSGKIHLISSSQLYRSILFMIKPLK